MGKSENNKTSCNNITQTYPPHTHLHWPNTIKQADLSQCLELQVKGVVAWIGRTGEQVKQLCGKLA